MSKPKKEFYWRVAAIALSTFYLGAEILQAIEQHGNLTGVDWKNSIIWMVLILVCEQLFELNQMVRHELVSKKSSLQHKVKRFLDARPGLLLTENLRGIAGTLQTTLDIDPEKGIYRVDNRDAAVDSYLRYWNLLNKRQADVREHNEKHKAKKPALQVRAIHTGSIKLWIDDSERRRPEMLTSHKRFNDSGGRIYRILMNVHDDLATPTEPYKRAIAVMQANGVNVEYLSPSRDLCQKLRSWDFLLANTEGSGGAAEGLIWADSGYDGNPHQAVYVTNQQYHGQDLNELWGQCLEELRRINPESVADWPE